MIHSRNTLLRVRTERISGAPGSGTILVIDDEYLIRKLAWHFLKRHGYQVVLAGGAAEALAICEFSNEAIDLVLSDIMMPEMNGFDLIREMRKTRQDFKVLFMSGFIQGISMFHREHLQDSNFLRKPFTATELHAKIQGLLQSAHCEA